MKTKTAKNVLHKITFLLCPSRVSRHSIIEFTTILKRGLCWNIFFFHALFLSTAFNAYSQITFQKTYAESSMRSPKSIQQTSDGGYILTGYGLFGSSKAEAYLLKVDADGVIEWTKLYGDGTSGLDNQYGNRVRQTNDGGYIVTGYTDGFGAAGKDIYVFKTDSVGNLEWAKTFGGSGEERGESVYQNADGTYVIGGYTYSFPGPEAKFYLLKLNGNGNLLWSKIYGGSGYDRCYSVQQTADSGYVLMGSSTGFGAGSYDYYLVKTDSLGNEEWSKTYGGSVGDFGRSVQQTTDGGYFLSGFVGDYGMGIRAMGVVKTFSDGTQDWAKIYGGMGIDQNTSALQTNNNGYIISGTTSSFGGSDMLLIKTDNNGVTEWAKIYLGTSDENAKVQLSSDGGYVICAATGNNFHLIKTNTLGGTGCNENNPATLESVWEDSTTTPGTVVGVTSPTESTITLSVVVTSRSPSTLVLCFSNCAPPAAPTAGTDTTYCDGDPVTNLTAIGDSIEWFSDAGLTNLLDTGIIFTPSPAIDTTTYYVTQTVSGCQSPSSSVVIVVNAIPSAPAAGNDTTYCDGDPVADLTAIGASIEWFSDPGLTTLIGTGTPFAITPTVDTTTYYVTQTVSGCQSPSSSVVIVVNTIPSAPTAGTDTTYCDGDPVADLIAIGANIEWFSDPGLTTLIGNGTPFAITPTVDTTTYYVTQTVSGCQSQSNSVIITVNAIPSAPAAGTDTTYCDGDPVADLTAIGDSIEWFSDTGLTNLIGTGSPFTITPSVDTTTWYVTQKVSGCQSQADSVMIVVNPLPVIDSVLSTNLTICGANDGTITIFASGGTSPLQYSIDGGGAFTTSGSFTGLSDGNFPVVVSDTNGCSITGSTLIITAPGVPPAPVAGSDTTYCDGDLAADLTAIGDSIEWFSDAGLTNQIGTGSPFTPTVIIGINTFYVTQTVGGCQSPADSVVIIVNSLPNVTLTSSDPDSTICSGDTITFTASPAGYDNYIFWNGAIPLQAGATNTYITTFLLAGNSITVTADDFASGCTSPPSNVISIIVNTAPVSDFSYTVSGLTANFSDSSSNANSWLWIFGGAGTSNAQNPTITFGQAGTYDVCLVVINNCGNDTLCDSVTVTTVGIEELAGKNNILFYPNPAKDEINISILLDAPTTLKLSLFNKLGEEIYSTNQKISSAQHEINIKTHNLTKGIYFVKIHLNNKESWVGKFVKID